MRHFDSSPARRRSRGLSLIEIMVGVAIALVTTLVIFQVFANSNNTNRSTAAGNEAQISGNIGMFQLERDLKAAGMGFGTLTTMSLTGNPCMVQAINPALATANFQFPLVPVVITPGVGGAPDQIDVLYGNSAFLASGRTFSGTGTGSTAIAKQTQSGVGINPGDVAIATNYQAGSSTPPTLCELVEITGPPMLPSPRVNLIEHRQGAGSGYTDFTTGLPVAAATRNSAGTPAPMNASGGMLYDLGAQPALNKWRITNNNSLGFTNWLGAGTQASVAEGVVHLVAQYGIDDGAAGVAVAGDGIISPAEWTSAAPANWSQVLAVRFALLARSGQLEKTAVSGTPTWIGGNFDMSAMPSDWRNYRYRVYESVVAMRNMIWGTSP